MSERKLASMSDDELAQLFGDVVQEIADRTRFGDRAMYELARNFWDEAAAADDD